MSEKVKITTTAGNSIGVRRRKARGSMDQRLKRLDRLLPRVTRDSTTASIRGSSPFRSSRWLRRSGWAFRSARTSKTASDFRRRPLGLRRLECLGHLRRIPVGGVIHGGGRHGDVVRLRRAVVPGVLRLRLFVFAFIHRRAAAPVRAYTIPDFAEGRFDSPLFRKIAVCFVLFIGFFYTMPQMKGAGVTLAYIFPGIPYWAGVGCWSEP